MERQEIVFKIATLENADQIHDVMEAVYQALEDKSLYVCDDIDYVSSHIVKDGFAVVACKKDCKIVGCFIFRYPDMQKNTSIKISASIL